MHGDAITDILIVLTAALALVPLLHRFGVSPILAYLGVGIILGPSGLKAIKDPNEAAWLAELGVVFMLFAIGLELPLERLKTMRYYVFGLGSAQVGATMLIIGAAAYLLGVPPAGAVVIGGMLALSSTATVLKLLVDRGEAAARFGRIAVAILLLQDLAVVPMLALIPLLGAGTGGAVWYALGLALGKAVLALGLIVFAGRFLIRPLFKQIASTGNAELFTAASLFILLGLGWITREAGMSMSLGAFLAGMLLAGTPYRHQIEADIHPFRGLLLGLFFVTVGMTFDLAALIGDIGPILLLAAGFILLKIAVTGLVARLFKIKSDTAWRAAFLLAQGSEFGFVLTSLASGSAILDDTLTLRLNAAIVISIALTPLLALFGQMTAKRIRDRRGKGSSLVEETERLGDHVLVAGFGRVGQAVCRLLDNAGITYVALDLNVQRVIRARASGMPVYFGDAGRLDVLRAAGINRASLAVIAIDNPAQAERMASALRDSAPQVPVLARAWDSGHAARLAKAGVALAVPEDIEIGLGLGSAMLLRLGHTQEEVEASVIAFRAEQQAFGSTEPDKTSQRISKD
ncbi:cation:proton antiporter [Dongia sp.]|uniref:cation:proton antiporter domain-containing protein n=1 Tax=Dongia sp. TaxID=1977262 RepID=UPI0035B2517F